MVLGIVQLKLTMKTKQH